MGCWHRSQVSEREHVFGDHHALLEITRNLGFPFLLALCYAPAGVCLSGTRTFIGVPGAPGAPGPLGKLHLRYNFLCRGRSGRSTRWKNALHAPRWSAAIPSHPFPPETKVVLEPESGRRDSGLQGLDWSRFLPPVTRPSRLRISAAVLRRHFAPAVISAAAATAVSAAAALSPSDARRKTGAVRPA